MINKKKPTTRITNSGDKAKVLPSNHYVDNKLFYKACLDHWNDCKEAEAKGLPKPRLSNYIGECLLKIARKLSFHPYFIGYGFRDEMILDGVENCCLYFHNFNPEKYTNPFSYFTTIIYHAFSRRIAKERKQMYVKHKSMFNMIDTGLSDYADHDEESVNVINIDQRIVENEYMKNFITNYEEKIEERKLKRAANVVKKKVAVIGDFLEE